MSGSTYLSSCQGQDRESNQRPHSYLEGVRMTPLCHSTLSGPLCPQGQLTHQHGSNHGLHPACFLHLGSSPTAPQMGSIVRPIFQSERLRLRQVRALARSPAGFQPGCSDSRDPNAEPPHPSTRTGSWWQEGAKSPGRFSHGTSCSQDLARAAGKADTLTQNSTEKETKVRASAEH